MAQSDRRIKEEGGIRERMYRARTGYRREQDRRLKSLEAENAALRAEVDRLRKLLAPGGAEIGDPWPDQLD